MLMWIRRKLKQRKCEHVFMRVTYPVSPRGHTTIFDRWPAEGSNRCIKCGKERGGL